jgi:hypothetical protein
MKSKAQNWYRKSAKPKTCSLEKVNKINNPLPRVIKRKKD